MKNILRAIGFGVLWWALMFAIVSALLPWYEHQWMKLLLALIAGVVAYALAAFAKLEDEKQALRYGAIWLIVGLILDALVTARFNPDIFSENTLWVGYFLTLCAPMVYAKRHAPNFWRKAALALVIGAGTAALLTYYGPLTKQSASLDYKNATYTIEGRAVELTRGMSAVDAAPGSAEKVVTVYFGNEVTKDLDGDGREDVAFLLTQERGGSGTFFYIVGALNTPSGVEGTQGYLLGDRVAPQTTESGPGRSVIVNYATRAPGEPFSDRASLGASKRLILDPQTKAFTELLVD